MSQVSWLNDESTCRSGFLTEISTRIPFLLPSLSELTSTFRNSFDDRDELSLASSAASSPVTEKINLESQNAYRCRSNFRFLERLSHVNCHCRRSIPESARPRLHLGPSAQLTNTPHPSNDTQICRRLINEEWRQFKNKNKSNHWKHRNSLKPCKYDRYPNKYALTKHLSIDNTNRDGNFFRTDEKRCSRPQGLNFPLVSLTKNYALLF